jgi:molecular chaperone GrpE (heat shock protein)
MDDRWNFNYKQEIPFYIENILDGGGTLEGTKKKLIKESIRQQYYIEVEERKIKDLTTQEPLTVNELYYMTRELNNIKDKLVELQEIIDNYRERNLDSNTELHV